MLEVEIESFQSIGHVSLQIDGFTVLLGRSNIGKSAIARAIECALTGATGTDFVRHGPRCERRLKKAKKCRCQCTVTIKGDGLKIVWEKGDDINQYRVTRGEGEERIYNALDRGDPEFLKPDFQQIQVGDSRELIQVSEQFKPIFLLNKTGGVVADVLSDVAKLDDVNEAIRLVNKDRKDATATRNIRDDDLRNLQKELDAFVDVDPLLTRIESLEVSFKNTGKLREDLARIESFLSSLRDLKTTMERLLAATKKELPNDVAKSKPAQTYFDLSWLYQNYEAKTSAVAHLGKVEELVLPDYAQVTERTAEVKRLTEWVRRVQAIKAAMAKHQALGPLPLRDLDTLRALHTKYSLLVSLSNRHSNLTKAISTLESQVDQAQQTEKALLDAYGELGVCPTCQQEVAPSHVHEAP
jgi:hypothetical protein